MEARNLPVSPETYFRLDAQSEEKLEYWNGHVLAMAGASRNHAVVKDDVVRLIQQQRPDCLALTAGLRVLAPGYSRQNYAYPDGLLICGPEQYDETNPPTLLNPTLLVEVTSPSTRSMDLDDKFEAYFKIDSLKDYWVVDPDRIHVRQYTRQEDAVIVTIRTGPDALIESPILNLCIPVRDVYARITLTP